MPLAPKIRPMSGQILMCEFGPNPDDVTGKGVLRGPLAVKPEIWKLRPGVVINTTNGTAIVVPLSTKIPETVKRYHVQIPAGAYQWSDQKKDSWAKCDMLEAVSYSRLDLPYVAGSSAVVCLSKAHFYAVRVAVLNALALGSIAHHLIDPTPKPKSEPAADTPSEPKEAG